MFKYALVALMALAAVPAEARHKSGRAGTIERVRERVANRDTLKKQQLQQDRIMQNLQNAANQSTKSYCTVVQMQAGRC